MKSLIPKKPPVHTNDFPVNVKESLTKYCNQRTVSMFESSTASYSEMNWPMPLWMNPVKIKIDLKDVILVNLGVRDSGKVNWQVAPLLEYWYQGKDFESVLFNIFQRNKKAILEQLLSNPTINSKKHIIIEIFSNYTNRHYTSAINLLFPVLDYLARKMLGTKNLRKDIKSITKLFDEIGISKESAIFLMPGYARGYSYNKVRLGEMTEEKADLLYENNQDNEFGLIGPILYSFINFSYDYYGYYNEDNINGNNNILNRHAIVHGSIDLYGTRTNSLKMITFLCLLLELEPVFEILFKQPEHLPNRN